MAMSGEMEWNIDMEVNLFHAMRGHKPAGVNRHFQMIAIHDKLSSSAKKMTSNDVWRHLSTLYDLQALNESEIVPFPNKAGDFALADREMLDLCAKSFPRSSYINAVSVSAKAEGGGKTISKLNSKLEPKLGSQTPKLESKTEHKPSSTSKADRQSTTPSSRSESKSSHSSNSNTKSSHNSSSSRVPSPSPKRTKRTRNVNSASASPSTPTEPQSKRRR